METPPLTRGRPASGRSSKDSSKKHPRLRGEDLQRIKRSFPGQETPPLTRGRLRGNAHLGHRFRNTPAYAGKTTRTMPEVRTARKHPRLRGEDFRSQRKDSHKSETPPLTRGRRNVASLKSPLHGNTPAYAGKTGRGVTLPLQAGKHPRLRGEDSSHQARRR